MLFIYEPECWANCLCLRPAIRAIAEKEGKIKENFMQLSFIAFRKSSLARLKD
jgi:hypothetical protein